MDLSAPACSDYELIDSGDGVRLERFGEFVFSRPSPVALWRRERPAAWDKADGVYHRNESGGGHWEFRRKPPAAWAVRWDGMVFSAKATGFGHTGLFPEHACHWAWLRDLIASAGRPLNVLNLFAYTGALTLVAAKAGAEVCHLDAVRDVNDWARRNAEASGLAGAPIRWITDDAVKFVAREIRRQRRYDGIILDPPSYGRGPGGEKWVLETDLAGLLDQLAQAAAAPPAFLLFTGHNPGFSPPLMRNMLAPWERKFGGRIEEGNMLVRGAGLQCALPSGFYARWTAAP